MARLHHPFLLLFAVLSFLSLTLAACKSPPISEAPSILRQKHTDDQIAATSFCKCTCFSNSTIIQLDGTSPSSSPNTPSPDDKAKKTRGTCSDCNKAFCLSYHLPICKGATEEDVFTTCFQRDSIKDEAVVFIFIAATTGLLLYAAARPWVEKWAEVRLVLIVVLFSKWEPDPGSKMILCCPAARPLYGEMILSQRQMLDERE